ncbi:MAG: M24 family metallopeptidase [Candidatus Njordarchaeales archaeon]
MLVDEVAKSRKERVIDLLKKYDADGWLVISSKNDPNLDYLLNASYYGLTAALLTRDSLKILASKLEESMVSKPHVDQVITYYGSRDFVAKLLELLKDVRDGRLLLNIAPPLVSTHASRISYGHAKVIMNLCELYGITVVSSHNFVNELRSIKTDAELTALEKSVKFTLEAIDNVVEKIKIGMSEKEVAAMLYKEIYLIAKPAFETIVAFGENTANPHHETSDKKLRAGEIGYIDVGIRYAGVCSDITRVFFTSTADAEFSKIYLAVREAQDASISKIRDGISAVEPDTVARETIKAHGYDPEKHFTHGLGHPLGVEVHDVGPALSFLSPPNVLLRKNMALTIEPAIYIEKKGGVRLEDDIIVESTSARRLSRSPEEPPKVG